MENMNNFENIILITIDSLRFDQVFDSRKNIFKLDIFKKLGKKGIFFKNAFANGAGTPACFPSIFSSTYPLMFGGYKSLSKKRTTFVEILQKKGFTTIGIPNNIYLSKVYGYNRGFDYFHDPLEKIPSRQWRIINNLSEILRRDRRIINLLQAIGHFMDIVPKYMEAEDIYKLVINFFEKNRQEPFFLWIHFMDPHLPYYSPKIKYPYKRLLIRNLHAKIWLREIFPNIICGKDIKILKKLYTQKINFLDQQLIRLYNALRNLKIFKESTLLIITADHGEEFYEHGDFLHKPKLYDELIHVPFLMHSKRFRKTKIEEKMIEHIDIGPTILNAVGIKPPSEYVGLNLFDILKNDLGKEYIVSEVAQPSHRLEIDYRFRKVAIRTKKWKFIYNEGGGIELFNILEDPWETNNIAENNPILVNLFLDLLRWHEKREELIEIKKIVRNFKI